MALQFFLFLFGFVLPIFISFLLLQLNGFEGVCFFRFVMEEKLYAELMFAGGFEPACFAGGAFGFVFVD